MNEPSRNEPHVLVRLMTVAAAVAGVVIVGLIVIVVLMVVDSRAGSRERGQLRTELERLRTTEADEEARQHCLRLYYDDLLTGSALSQIALSDLFVSAVGREPPLTEAERDVISEDNVRLVDELDAANAPLRNAVDALNAYKAIYPPPDQCPHPDYNGGPP